MVTDEAARSLGERVSELRRERGLSQRQLADMAGLGRDAVLRLEHNRSKARKATIMAVARTLGVSYSELVGEDAEESFQHVMASPPIASSPPEQSEHEEPFGVQEEDPNYLTVYVGDRSEEEVLKEVRQRYRQMRALRGY